MNSEILGLPTESGSGVVFAKSVNDILMFRFDGRVDEISFHKRSGEMTENGVPITIRLKYGDGVGVDELSEKIITNQMLKATLWDMRNKKSYIRRIR